MPNTKRAARRRAAARNGTEFIEDSVYIGHQRRTFLKKEIDYQKEIVDLKKAALGWEEEKETMRKAHVEEKAAI